jgi:hypothetical protein
MQHCQLLSELFDQINSKIRRLAKFEGAHNTVASDKGYPLQIPLKMIL